ncbi:peptidyl-prolyl cis-trans isomerase FKBP43-like [Hibiscus syriacus]|uniref:peptidyl-prolyl cis-trans isomerase FKBP43-like n=1 Tax=Hibiscus syriacus TaxID=106335 RepID=UPI001924B06F|nr:peptidyl-prolyl cis-trans isomerase FKBP43-like [Hibiscus syriacus]
MRDQKHAQCIGGMKVKPVIVVDCLCHENHREKERFTQTLKPISVTSSLFHGFLGNRSETWEALHSCTSQWKASSITGDIRNGNGEQKSIVQCNVGNSRPVFLCSLFPDKAECCQLNLEFEESDEVVFSVIGPRTVHLTGYYMGSTRLDHHHNDESESYGEDIAETETERTKSSEESEYGGSFIDDDDEPKAFSPSEEFSAGSGSKEEMHGLKFKCRKGKRRRLRKKYQKSDSDNESSQQKDFTNGVAPRELLDSETEDTLPISSLFSGKCASKSGKDNIGGETRKETGNHNNNETDDNATMSEGINGVQLECKSGMRNVDRLEELVEEERLPEADHCVVEKVNLEQNEQNQKLASNEKCQSDNLLTPSQVGTADGANKLNRKRKKHFEDSDTKGDEVPKSGSNLNHVIEDVLMEDKETQNQVNDNHSKKRKKKKRCKDKREDAVTKMEPPVLSAPEKEQSVVDLKDKNTSDQEIQLSNGMIIEELEMGKPNGKIASLGKKVRVHYTVKLKDSGELIDSSADKGRLKFRLGEGQVQELWKVGLDGMQVGGKRRLTVPPWVRYRKGQVRIFHQTRGWFLKLSWLKSGNGLASYASFVEAYIQLPSK